MDHELHGIWPNVVLREPLVGYGLVDRYSVARGATADQLERRPARPRSVLERDLRLPREGAVGLCPLVHVTFHVKECLIALQDFVELHSGSPPVRGAGDHLTGAWGYPPHHRP